MSLEKLFEEWKYFWISVAVMLGSLRVQNVADFVGIELISDMKFLLFIFLFCSISFCIIFLLVKIEWIGNPFE